MSPNESRPELSVVVPCFNEAQVLPLFLEAFNRFAASLSGSWELILVDDGSTDTTWSLVQAASQKDARVRGIRLSRNFGHQGAMWQGLHAVRGQAVVTMDADLQHPLEVIPQLVAKWKEGYTVVQTLRRDVAGGGVFKRLTSWGFYRVFQWLAGIPLSAGSSDFRLLDRKALDCLLALEESSLFLRGMVLWIGFKRVEIEFDVAVRKAGHSKFTLRKMLRLALDGITSFTHRPLYLSLYSGLILGVFVAVYGGYVLYQVFVSGQVVPGWASSVLLTGVLGTFILLNQGLQGLYLSRIFQELKRRPQSIVSETTP